MGINQVIGKNNENLVEKYNQEQIASLIVYSSMSTLLCPLVVIEHRKKFKIKSSKYFFN